jgi:hypothetical protein
MPERSVGVTVLPAFFQNDRLGEAGPYGVVCLLQARCGDLSDAKLGAIGRVTGNA